jgi:hypothetical protein
MLENLISLFAGAACVAVLCQLYMRWLTAYDTFERNRALRHVHKRSAALAALRRLRKD